MPTIVKGLTYTLAYKLVMGDGRWFVSSGIVLEEDKVENLRKGDRQHLEKVQVWDKSLRI